MAANSSEVSIYRRGFGLKSEVADTLSSEYKSNLIQILRENDFSLQIDDLRILLAKEFGFCYGVDRAVDYAYETLEKFPERTIYITTEIIHNPRVNRKLQELGIRFLSGTDEANYSYDDIKAEDVVLLPAFGASVEQMQKLSEIGCVMVDTTCGSVMNVWRRVEHNARDGYTSVIHGKYTHEETIATSSRALQFPNGHYVIVRNEEEAEYVCHYIRHGGNKEEFLKKFEYKTSPGFDPDRHLNRVGVANQTTMLSSESLHISKMLGEAMAERYGTENLREHFRAFDTICSATQERQDAIIALGAKNPDVILVVGGYNSSNTNHLCEIGLRYAPTYHINEVDCIISAQEIRHKLHGDKNEIITRDWLPQGPVTLGVTSGASTPDKVVEEAIIRVCACRGYDFETVVTAAGAV
ncbi:MAG: 4-hydroxy-3-methylbut-2-enyl diphosphate reductase [bacterium]|jgi:4-hydroxy-3-methylbut-2-enyl diphosphate reductase